MLIQKKKVVVFLQGKNICFSCNLKHYLVSKGYLFSSEFKKCAQESVSFVNELKSESIKFLILALSSKK